MLKPCIVKCFDCVRTSNYFQNKQQFISLPEKLKSISDINAVSPSDAICTRLICWTALRGYMASFLLRGVALLWDVISEADQSALCIGHVYPTAETNYQRSNRLQGVPEMGWFHFSRKPDLLKICLVTAMVILGRKCFSTCSFHISWNLG